jgi:uroporphyrinogen decarboxylase
MIETFFWPETIARWHNEGFPRGADPVDYFQLDRVENVFGVFDCFPQATPRVLEESESCIIRVNKYGAVVKEPRDGSEQPVMLEPGIRDRHHWGRVRETLVPQESRIDRAAISRARELREAGVFVTIETIEPLWFVLHNTMGYENGLLAMAEAPEFVEDIIATYTAFSVDRLELCFREGLTADGLWFFSDLCYKNGPLFAPAQFRRLALPHLMEYTRLCERHDLYFWWHCDGNVEQLIPLLVDLGVDAIHPLEARAGNDARAYKQRFGDSLCLIGNIDADVVATGDAGAIEREVASKVPVASAGGGYMYHIDHSVPPTVAFDAYCFLLETVRKHGAYGNQPRGIGG